MTKEDIIVASDTECSADSQSISREESAETDVNQDFTKDEIRRNMTFLIMVESIWTTGAAEFSIALVPLLVFLSASNTTIGLVSGAGVMGLFGIFVSPWISRRFPRKKWYLMVASIPYLGPIGLCGMVVVLSRMLGVSNNWLLVFVVSMMLAYNFFGGFSGLPRQEYVVACIPMSHRGRFTGYSTSIGSAISMVVTALGGWIVYHYTQPMAFGYLLIMMWLSCQSGAILATLAKEKPVPVEKSPKAWSKGMLKAAWENKPFRNVMMLYTFFGIMIMPASSFIAVYGLKELHMNAATVAIQVMICQIIRTPSAAIAGILTDRYGPKRLIMLTPLSLALYFLPVVLIHNAYGIYIAVVVWNVLGMMWNSAYVVLTYGLPKPEHRSGHFTLQILIQSSVTALGSIMAGLLCDVVSYRTVFIGAIVLALCSYPFVKWVSSTLYDDIRSYS